MAYPTLDNIVCKVVITKNSHMELTDYSSDLMKELRSMDTKRVMEQLWPPRPFIYKYNNQFYVTIKHESAGLRGRYIKVYLSTKEEIDTLPIYE